MIVSLLKILTRIWKFISFPILGERCRFYPTCSEYMVGAIENHGVSRGVGLGLKRICRCHPFSEGGLDFVPENKSNKQ